MTTTSATRGNSVRDSTHTRCAARTHEQTTAMHKQRATRENGVCNTCEQHDDDERNTRESLVNSACDTRASLTDVVIILNQH
jgi:hypothetical protein